MEEEELEEGQVLEAVQASQLEEEGVPVEVAVPVPAAEEDE